MAVFTHPEGSDGVSVFLGKESVDIHVSYRCPSHFYIFRDILEIKRIQLLLHFCKKDLSNRTWIWPTVVDKVLKADDEKGLSFLGLFSLWPRWPDNICIFCHV